MTRGQVKPGLVLRAFLSCAQLIAVSALLLAGSGCTHKVSPAPRTPGIPLQAAPGRMRDAAPEPETFSLMGRKLSVQNQSGNCSLLVEHERRTTSLDLGIPYPCQVHRDRAAQVRTHQVKTETRLLFETSKIHPDSPRDCITNIRGVGLRSDQIMVSPHTSRVASCPPFQWDIKMFLGLFER